ncbi:MAG: hypothetical protein JSW67_04710 [Candidatus Latescibacterota bacterium]|nr:MAG: hypothetical protein JSW67_04710 [Candidatus Latescibacterota bacterium]
MRRMLISSAVALALVATMGVGVASAQKGKERRKEQPVKVRIECTNLTTGEIGRHISASTGDSVSITLRVDNRSGLSQQAVVAVHGEVPEWAITYDEEVVEFFAAGERKTATVSGTVPGAPIDPVLLIDVSVMMTKSEDIGEWDASVTFGPPLKVQSQSRSGVGLFHRIFARAVFRSLLALSSDGDSDDAASVSISEFKGLYR